MRERTHTVSRVLVFVSAALLIATALAAAGCAEKEASASTASAGAKKAAPAEVPAAEAAETVPRAVNVKIAPLEPTDVTEIVAANGTAEARSDIVYSAEIAGKVKALPLKIGDRVRAGQLLARIDVAMIAAQATQVDAAYDLSKSTLDRLSALETDELVSKQQMDEVRSQVTSAESQRTLIRTQLSKSAVRADRAGVVANVFVERSEFVGPGQPIAQIVDLHEMIVEAHLAETQVAGIRKGDAAEVALDALGESFAGEVEAIVPAADKDSKTFAVRVKVANPDEKILVGMSARVRIAVGELAGVLSVPQSAVLEGADGRSVYVADGGKAHKRAVKLGAVDGDRVVLVDGVKAGERLIVVGQRDLVDGQPIAVVQ
jgi:membrane fusion protein, multidrug efflux system